MANYLERIWPDFKDLARSKRKENKKFFSRLSKQDGKKLNAQFHAMHEEVFAETDCLKCARCCRATGPLLTKQDIQRISKKQGMKQADFEKQYLRVDEDGDWVMKSLPCPFLELATNKCTIYEYAPKACRQYPHTDHPNMKSILGLTQTNVRHCPAVYEMIERMKARV
ncbi:MAG: YkgJ family cysteine cluster protein [Schleiferiaceae bacterium]